jgi:hypothetical protein
MSKREESARVRNGWRATPLWSSFSTPWNLTKLKGTGPKSFGMDELFRGMD